MPNYDAGSLNKSKRATKQYRDLDLDFGRNSVTNDVNKLTDIEAVKRSVRKTSSKKSRRRSPKKTRK